MHLVTEQRRKFSVQLKPDRGGLPRRLPCSCTQAPVSVSLDFHQSPAQRRVSECRVIPAMPPSAEGRRNMLLKAAKPKGSGATCIPGCCGHCSKAVAWPCMQSVQHRKNTGGPLDLKIPEAGSACIALRQALANETKTRRKAPIAAQLSEHQDQSCRCDIPIGPMYLLDQRPFAIAQARTTCAGTPCWEGLGPLASSEAASNHARRASWNLQDGKKRLQMFWAGEAHCNSRTNIQPHGKVLLHGAGVAACKGPRRISMYNH